jgi:hypothetical protein
MVTAVAIVLIIVGIVVFIHVVHVLVLCGEPEVCTLEEFIFCEELLTDSLWDQGACVFWGWTVARPE